MVSHLMGMQIRCGLCSNVVYGPIFYTDMALASFGYCNVQCNIQLFIVGFILTAYANAGFGDKSIFRHRSKGELMICGWKRHTRYQIMKKMHD